MAEFIKENDTLKMETIHGEEKLRIAIKALESLKNTDRELAIQDAAKENKLNETTKVCPNLDCGVRYPKNLRKCPSCDVWYEKHLNEIGDTGKGQNQFEDSNLWCPDEYYKHINSSQPPNSVTSQVLDPLLNNPNSKINILALLHHIKQSADINGNQALPKDTTFADTITREDNRQWTFVACDALIALQV